MNGNIVNAVAESKHFLTVETTNGNFTSAVLCDLDGNIIPKGITYAGTDPAHVEVYLDSLTGEHVARITHSQMLSAVKAGTKVYQGVGGVHGWFVDAPDYTVNGRHGGGAVNVKAPVFEDDSATELPSPRTNHRLGAPAKRVPATSRNKKGTNVAKPETKPV